MAIRANGIPLEAAATISRTATLASSSGSATERTASSDFIWVGTGDGTAPPSRSTRLRAGSSAASLPVRAAMTATGRISARAASSARPESGVRPGTCSIRVPSSSSRGSVGSMAAAARCRSTSSMNRSARRSRMRRWSRMTSDACREVVATLSSWVWSSSLSSRWTRTRARSVAGWCATGRSRSADLASVVRTAEPTTGSEIRRRRSSARAVPANSLARPSRVSKRTAARPGVPPALCVVASDLRAATPTRFDGTITVTGASGLSPLAVAMALASAAVASVPYEVKVKVAAIVRREYARRVTLGGRPVWVSVWKDRFEVSGVTAPGPRDGSASQARRPLFDRLGWEAVATCGDCVQPYRG
ncbi:MAG: hypothetical protein MAG471_00846 [Acidimicrobiaceae bacterium]|nr:hypothetical protein [Acidimicrobiaceae bacterium]